MKAEEKDFDEAYEKLEVDEAVHRGFEFVTSLGFFLMGMSPQTNFRRQTCILMYFLSKNLECFRKVRFISGSPAEDDITSLTLSDLLEKKIENLRVLEISGYGN